MAEKSFLVQKFARIPLGNLHVVGYSVAGEETVVQIPELNVCFDIGRAPYFALTSDYVCLTHGHMDHLAGLAYYLSQRYFQGMKPGTVLLPRELERPVDAMLRCWRDVERQGTPYKLIPMSPGQMYEVRRDFGIRAYQTHHGTTSLGYGLISIREKLKPEFGHLAGPELAELKKQGTEIQYKLEVPIVCFLGDTTAGPIFDEPDVQNAEVLITECTFLRRRPPAQGQGRQTPSRRAVRRGAAEAEEPRRGDLSRQPPHRRTSCAQPAAQGGRRRADEEHPLPDGLRRLD